MLKKNISLEDLEIVTGPSEAEVEDAKSILEGAPEDADIIVQEHATEIIKMTEAGEILQNNVDTLQTFADDADRLLEAGVVTGSDVNSYVTDVNKTLATIDEKPLEIVSTESVGSCRVSLESASVSTKDRIKQIREFIERIAKAIIAKMKEFWRDYVTASGRFKAKATLVAKEAAKMNRGAAPKSDTIKYNAKFLTFAGNDAHHVLNGITSTVKSIDHFLAEVKEAAKRHHDFIKISCMGASGNGDATGQAPKNGWNSGVLSGNYSIELDNSHSLPVFRLKNTAPGGEADIAAPMRDDLTMIANETRELAHALQKFTDAETAIVAIYNDQRKLFSDLCAHALANPGTVSSNDIRRIGDLTNKHFGNDLIAMHRYYQNVGTHALAFVVKGLRNY